MFAKKMSEFNVLTGTLALFILIDRVNALTGAIQNKALNKKIIKFSCLKRLFEHQANK